MKECSQARVELVTRQVDGVAPNAKRGIEIIIRDNGTGIPDAIKQKIFDPFFTTKPTGFGSTGLGLSISFDVIKAQAGEIRFESKEGEGSDFSIFLPV